MAQLTIADDEPRIQFTVGSTASTGPFAIPFEFFNTNDIKVVVTDRTTLIDTQLAQHPTGFTITATAVEDGFLKDGSLTLASAVTNSFVTIYLVLDLTRTTNFPLSGAFDIASLNTQLSRVFASLKQQSLTLARTIQFGRSDSTNSFKIPADRANKVLSFDADKNLTATNAVGVNRGDWAAGTAYDIRDLVKDTTTNNIFMSNAVHTSSGALPLTSNPDSAKWDLIVDAASSTVAQTGASTSAAAAAASQVAAAGSQSAAATSETNAAASAATSSSQAGISTTQANASSASAVASAASAVEAANEVAVLAPRYKFSAATTVADPGVSFLRFNNSAAANTTVVIINEKTADSGNPDIEDWLKTWDDSTSSVKGYIRIVDPNTPANYAIFHITGLTDQTAHVQLQVTHVDSNFVSGTTFVEDNTLRITFSRSGDAAIGPQGIQGIQGNSGAAATIQIGSTSTSAPGSNATVNNSGNANAAVFDFSIPRGDTGATGPAGSTGSAATVAIGTVSTGAPGSAATVQNVGTSTAATFNFSIPQGDTGVSGSGTGDVTSSNSSTVDNRLVRMNGTTGKQIQDSNVLLSDAGIISATGLTLGTDLSVLHGGTGKSSHTTNGVLFGNGSGAIGATSAGSSGQVLTSNGSGSAPTYQNAASGGGPGLDGGTAGEESVIRLNANQISGNASLTVQTGKNGMTAGPINIAAGSSLTIETGASWHLIGA